jgi:hypothetical protein
MVPVHRLGQSRDRGGRVRRAWPQILVVRELLPSASDVRRIRNAAPPRVATRGTPAGCVDTRTSGSEGGLRKRPGRKTDIAPQPDPCSDEVGPASSSPRPRLNKQPNAAPATATKAGSGRPNAAATSTTHRHSATRARRPRRLAGGVVLSAFMLDPGLVLNRPVAGGQAGLGKENPCSGAA